MLQGLGSLLGGCGAGALGDDGFDAGDLTANLGQTRRVFELAATGALLDAQVERLLLQFTTA